MLNGDDDKNGFDRRKFLKTATIAGIGIGTIGLSGKTVAKPGGSPHTKKL